MFITKLSSKAWLTSPLGASACCLLACFLISMSFLCCSSFLLNRAKFKGGVFAIFNCLLFVFYLSIYLFIWD